MINVDYSLEIINEKKTYSPRKEFINPIANSSNKIFEITADNSYGKTFLLNLIAHSLSADKLDSNRILPSIKDAISRYNNSKHYNLSYNIDLKLPDESILHIQKDINNEKIVSKNEGPPIGHNQLHKELSIIYDVPINPSERLDAVIKDLSIWNESITQKITSISKKLFDITKAFDNIRDENKIEELQNKIEESRVKNSTLKNDSDNLDDTKNKLSTYIDLHKILELDKQIDKIKLNISKDKSHLKKIPKPSNTSKKDESKIRELNTKLSQLNREVKDIISKMIELINEDTELKDFLLNKQSINISYENLIKIDSIETIIEEDKLDVFFKNLDNLKDEIIRFIENKKNDDSYAIKDMYTSLIEILDKIVDRNIDFHLNEIAALETSKLKEELQKIISTYIIKDYKKYYDFVKSDLKEIRGKCSLFIRTNNLLKQENKKTESNDLDSKYYKLKGNLDSNKEKLNNLNNQRSIIQSRCINTLKIEDLEKFNNNITDYIFYIKNEISDKSYLNDPQNSIAILSQQINDIQKSITINEQAITLANASLEIEKEKNPSEFTESQKKKINNFKTLLILIVNNLNNYKSIISKIENKTFNEFTNDSDKEYVKLAGKIIANSMDNKLLRPDGEFIELNHYDMISQQFHCENEIIINKADVSTGLASANYLKQKIDNVEGKYVVVLLDEIGNMAQNALDKVIDSIKKLQKDNRLVLALLTSPNSNGIKIKEY